MLPEFLVGTYRQYKDNTKVIATWLGSTARAYGYVSEAIPSEQTIAERLLKSKSKSKSKPRTKKQKRDAARRIPKEQRGQFVIELDEFLPLAEYVSVNLKPPSKVPSSILSILKHVIDARKDSDDWFRTNTQEDDRNGHIHFVRVLQDVYDILQPFGLVEDEHSPAAPDMQTDIENTFKSLQLEEPSQTFLDSPGLPVPNQMMTRMLCDSIDFVMGHVGSVFEESLAASSLFRDVNKIYRHVHSVWQNYRDGGVDLMTAAITSNTAVDLVRRLEEEFLEQFPYFGNIDAKILKDFEKDGPKHTNAQQLIWSLFEDRCAGKKKDMFNKDKKQAHFNLEMYDDARYLFLDMHSILLTYFVGSQKMNKCVYRPRPELGSWDPDANYEELSALEKHRQDRRILLELLPDVVLLATSLSKIPALGEDELLRGSRGFRPGPERSPTVHLWMLISLRIFCDVHHILGPKIGKPFEAIRKLGSEASDSITECIRQRDDGKCESWSKELDESIEKNILDRIHQSLYVDEVKEYIDNAARNVKGWQGKHGFELLRRHPWACGLMEFNIRISMQEAGLIALDQSNSGVTTAHLYNALQQQGILGTPWPDMESFMELLGNEQIFRGNKPVSLEDCSTRLCVMRGISTKTFANNRRDRGILLSKHGQYHLFPRNDLLSILKDRYVNVENHPEIADDESAAMLKGLEEVLNEEICLASSGAQVTVRDRSEVRKEDADKLGIRKDRKYNPVELLMALQFALARELPAISFDYLAFHKSCWEVLNIVLDIFGPILEARMSPVFSILKEHDNLRAVVCVDVLFSLGVPYVKAIKMVRKVVLPVLPPMTYEYQQMFNHHAILDAIGDAINDRLVNGRMEIPANVRARTQIEVRPEVIYFELPAISSSDSHLTMKDHKLWKHKDPGCTRNLCVCGVKPLPMMKPGWRRTISKAAERSQDGKL